MFGSGGVALGSADFAHMWGEGGGDTEGQLADFGAHPWVVDAAVVPVTEDHAGVDHGCVVGWDRGPAVALDVYELQQLRVLFWGISRVGPGNWAGGWGASDPKYVRFLNMGPGAVERDTVPATSEALGWGL